MLGTGLNMSTSDDRLLDGRVIVRQPLDGYRAAIDPVLLAAAVRAKAGENVLDAGCGTGAAMFCLAARVPGLTLTGLELQQAHAVLAGEGVALNKLAETFIATGDILKPPPDLVGAFDVVISNPPYGDSGTPPLNAARAISHMEGEADLAAWIGGCLACAKPKGRIVLIHRADRLSDIVNVLHAKKTGDIRIIPIFPKAGAPAKRVIVDAGKGRRTADTLYPGIILHEADGRYTAAADAVLRDARALVF